MASKYDLLLDNIRKKYQSKNNNNNQPDQEQNNSDYWDDVKAYEDLNWWEKFMSGAYQVEKNIETGILDSFEGIYDSILGFARAGTEAFGSNSMVGKNIGSIVDKEKLSKILEREQNKDYTSKILNSKVFELSKKYRSNQLLSGGKSAMYYGYNDDYSQQNLPEIIDSLSQGIGSAAGFAATGALGGGSKLAQNALMFASASGIAMEQSSLEGANAYESLGYGILSGGTEVILENTVGKLLDLVGLGGTGKYAGALGKETASKGITKLASTGAGKAITKIVQNFTEEGLEEAISSFADPLIQNITYKQDKSYSELFNEQGGWEAVIESFLIGGASGGIFEGVNIAGTIGQVGLKGYDISNELLNMSEINNEIKQETLKGNQQRVDELITKKQELINSVQSKFDSFVNDIIENKGRESTLQARKNLATEYATEATKTKQDLTVELSNEMLDGKVKVESTKEKSSYYDPNKNTVYLSKNHTEKIDTALNTISHELLHSANSKTLVEEIVKNIDNIDGLMNEYSAIYKNNNEEYIKEEIAADYFSKLYLNDLNHLKRIINKNDSKGIFKLKNVIRNLYDGRNKPSNYKEVMKMFTDGISEKQNTEQVKQVEKKYKKTQSETTNDIVDSQGKKLTEKQIERFKESKVRDEKGNLQVVYHTAPAGTGGFTVFDANRGNQHYRYKGYYVNFFTDDYEMSSSYARDIRGRETIPKDFNPYSKEKIEKYDDFVQKISDKYNKDDKYSDNQIKELLSDLQELVKILDKNTKLKFTDKAIFEYLERDDVNSAINPLTGEVIYQETEEMKKGFQIIPSKKIQQIKSFGFDYDGKYNLFEVGLSLETKNDLVSALILFDSLFKNDMGIGNSSFIYSTYLDIKKPLIVEGNGVYWNEILFNPDKNSNSKLKLDVVDKLIKKKTEVFDNISGNIDLENYYNDIFDLIEKNSKDIGLIIDYGFASKKRRFIIDSNTGEIVNSFNFNNIGEYNFYNYILDEVNKRLEEEKTLDKRIERFIKALENYNQTESAKKYGNCIRFADYYGAGLHNGIEWDVDLIKKFGLNKILDYFSEMLILYKSSAKQFTKEIVEHLRRNSGFKETSTNDIVKWAIKQGDEYDGVIFKNIKDYGGGNVVDFKPHNVYVTIKSPNQIKDIRNENPTDDLDIRYKLTDMDLPEDQIEINEIPEFNKLSELKTETSYVDTLKNYVEKLNQIKNGSIENFNKEYSFSGLENKITTSSDNRTVIESYDLLEYRVNSISDMLKDFKSIRSSAREKFKMIPDKVGKKIKDGYTNFANKDALIGLEKQIKYYKEERLSQLREKVDSFNQEENELNLIKNQYKERVIDIVNRDGFVVYEEGKETSYDKYVINSIEKITVENFEEKRLDIESKIRKLKDLYALERKRRAGFIEKHKNIQKRLDDVLKNHKNISKEGFEEHIKEAQQYIDNYGKDFEQDDYDKAEKKIKTIISYYISVENKLIEQRAKLRDEELSKTEEYSEEELNIIKGKGESIISNISNDLNSSKANRKSAKLENKQQALDDMTTKVLEFKNSLSTYEESLNERGIYALDIMQKTINNIENKIEEYERAMSVLSMEIKAKENLIAKKQLIKEENERKKLEEKQLKQQQKVQKKEEEQKAKAERKKLNEEAKKIETETNEKSTPITETKVEKTIKIIRGDRRLIKVENAETVKLRANLNQKTVYTQTSAKSILTLVKSVFNTKGLKNQKFDLYFDQYGQEQATNDIFNAMNSSDNIDEVCETVYTIIEKGIRVKDPYVYKEANGKLRAKGLVYKNIVEAYTVPDEVRQTLKKRIVQQIKTVLNEKGELSILSKKIAEATFKLQNEINSLMESNQKNINEIENLKVQVKALSSAENINNKTIKSLEKTNQKLNDKLNEIKTNAKYLSPVAKEEIENLKSQLKATKNAIKAKEKELNKKITEQKKILETEKKKSGIYNTTGNSNKLRDLFKSYLEVDNFQLSSELKSDLNILIADGKFDEASDMVLNELSKHNINGTDINFLDAYSKEVINEFRTQIKDYLESTAKTSKYKTEIEKLRASLIKAKAKNAVIDENKVKEKINKSINSLKKSLAEKGGSLTPELARQVTSIADFFSKISMTKIKQGSYINELIAIRQLLTETDGNGNIKFTSETGVEVPEILISSIDNILSNQGNLNQTYLEELEDYHKLIKVVNEFVKKAKGLRQITFGSETYTINEFCELGVKELNEIKEKVGNEKWNVLFNTLDPRVIFLKMSAYQESGTWYKVYNMLCDGREKFEAGWLDLSSEYREFSESNKKFLKKLNDKITLDVINQEVTIAEAFSIYKLLRRDHSRKHILIDGFDLNGKVVKFETEEQLTDFEMSLMKQLKLDDSSSVEFEYYNIITKFFEKAGDMKREVDEKLYGISNLESGEYFPINISEVNKSIKFDSKTFQSPEMQGSLNYSWNKGLTSFRGSVNIKGVDYIVNAHLKQVSMYYGYAEILENFKQIYNHKMSENKELNIASGDSLGSLTKSRFGKDKNGTYYLDDYLRNLISDIQGIRGNSGLLDSKLNKNVNKLRAKFSRYVLGANLNTIFSQFSSLFTATKYINILNIAKGFVSKVNVQLPTLARYRNINKSIVQASTLTEKIDTQFDIFTAPMIYADSFVVKTMWKASLIQCNFDIDKATQLFNKTLRETQQQEDPLQKAALYRNENELVRGVLMFSSQSPKNISNVYEVVDRIKYSSKLGKDVNNKQNVSNFASVASSFVMLSLLSILNDLILDRYDDEEEPDESFFEKLGEKLFNESLIKSIPLLNQISFEIKDGKADINFYDIEIGIIGYLNDILSEGTNVINGDLTDKGKSLLKISAMIAGFPFENLRKYFTAIAGWFGLDELVAEANILFDKVSLNDKSDINQAIKKGDLEQAKIYYTKYNNQQFELSESTSSKMFELYSNGYSNVYIKKIPDYLVVNDEQVEIDKDKFSNVYSTVEPKLNRLMNSISFSKAKSEVKQKAFSSILESYFTLAKTQYDDSLNLSSKQLLFTSNYRLYANDVVYLANISNIASTEQSSKKQLVQKYINSLNISSAQKYLLYALSGYKINDEQIKKVKSFLLQNGMSYKQVNQLLESLH